MVALRLPAELDSCGIGFVADAQGRAGRHIVELALTGLARMRHRGAIAADGVSGDGAGLLLPIPVAFFGTLAASEGATSRPDTRLGLVSAFLDADDSARCAVARRTVEEACAAEGLNVSGWRDVPIDEPQLGAHASADLPAIVQAVLSAPAALGDDELERRAYRARRRAERACAAAGVRHSFSSWSFRTVTYRALVTSDRLAAFYPDLADDAFGASFAVFHSRFSTNTAPAWERAQPLRLLCHNGEINTIAGNQRRMAARAHLGTVEAGLGPEELFHPVLDPDDSDSGDLDRALELLVSAGRDVRHAVSMLVPPAWESAGELDGAWRGFARYHACLTDPWDGPAALVFTDGRVVGAALDRNGLRPLRWQACDDGLVVCASEAGAVPLTGHGAVRRGRLGPGGMLCVDPARGGVQHGVDVQRWLAAGAPYARWAEEGLVPFGAGEPLVPPAADPPASAALTARQAAFGLSKEELAMVLKPLAADAREPTFAMGDDTPFAAASTQARPVSHYLRQRFAQVSNPAMDHLRERGVMSLRTCLGRRAPLLSEGPEAARLLELPTFFLYPSALDVLLDARRSSFPARRLDATFPVRDGPGGLRRALDRLADDARVAVTRGAVVLVVSDAVVDAGAVPVPSLLAAGRVHGALVAAGTRPRSSIVVDAGDARDTHAVAALLGFGADAVCPRLALETVAQLADAEQLGELTAAAAQARYRAAIEDGVLKIMAKMGIATLDGYRGAQIFEALGLGPEVADVALGGVTSSVGGLGLDALGTDALTRHTAGFGVERVTLGEPGYVRFRKRGGEYHGNNPSVCDAVHAVAGVVPARAAGEDDEAGGGRAEGDAAAEPGAVIPPAPVVELQLVDRTIDTSHLGPQPDLELKRAAHLLQEAVRAGRAELYDAFRELVRARPVTELHDLLELVPAGEPAPLAEVEPAIAITRRFSTGAMSHGALSREAHETLAAAMNLVGGRSNCGEGGEERRRFRSRGRAYDVNSRIKQIASGRFGVTPEYCVFADELNIKIAQGSKPGEGGQLPGHKVSTEIARLRHTQAGVGLISPPPHHDIYSIEDLAQLVYDLKQVNPCVEVSVKLVAESGVGTIASGVAKALADIVQVSGANGGTGASPLSSIKHAGMPWELGLVDTQHSLVAGGLRDRVRVRVDGGFRTGLDVMVAALLGADEYSFGTMAMVAEGCIMVRACHKDTCPTGIATQRPNLRAKFAGTPEGVAQYMLFVAEEVRSHLASLGLRTLDEAIGRIDLLRRRDTDDARLDTIDVSPLLRPPEPADSARRYVAGSPVQRPRSTLDARLLDDAFRVLWDGDEVELEYAITNADRTVGASLGGAIGVEWGDGLPPGRARVHLLGSAGQSFGAFLGEGVSLDLRGEANDYVGKGMAGGTIVIRPPEDDAGAPVLAGNTVLYGATGGRLFVAGCVGERFAVRNSGATAVVEGTGDHACEYMTGGTVVVLGPVGANLGAGMTGGQAYVLDPGGTLAVRCNRQLVDVSGLDDAQEAELRFLLERHAELTGSGRAGELLADWEQAARRFRRVAPVDEVSRIERVDAGLLAAAR